MLDNKNGKAEEPLFVKIDGGNRRKSKDYSAARENFLGSFEQKSRSETSGRRVAAVRDANRLGHADVHVEKPDPRRRDMSGDSWAVTEPARRHISEQKRKPVHRKTGRNEQAQEGISVVPLFNMIRSALRKKRIGDNYLMGAIGAVIGVLAACIIGAFVTAFIPRFYGLISTVVPVWACVGYMTLNGRRGKSKTPVIIILVLSFIGVMIIGFCSDIFAPAVGSGMTLKRSWRQFKGNLGDGKYWMNSIVQAIVPMIFAAIGMMMSMPRILHRPVKKKRTGTKAA